MSLSVSHFFNLSALWRYIIKGIYMRSLTLCCILRIRIYSAKKTSLRGHCVGALAVPNTIRASVVAACS